MKVVDPSSVVREAEFNTAQKATSLLDQFNIKVGQVSTGQILNPTVRQQIKDTMANRFNVAEKNQKRIVDSYTQRAKGHKIDPSDVIIDYGYGSESEAQTPSTKKPSNIPSDIGSTISNARKQGYSDKELVDFFLEKYPDQKERIDSARSSGYSDQEILNYYSK